MYPYLTDERKQDDLLDIVAKLGFEIEITLDVKQVLPPRPNTWVRSSVLTHIQVQKNTAKLAHAGVNTAPELPSLVLRVSSVNALMASMMMTMLILSAKRSRTTGFGNAQIQGLVLEG